MEKRTSRTPRNKSAPRRPNVPSPAVTEVEQRLALILESTTEGYWDWNPRTGEVHYSQGWLSSLGYVAADLSKDMSFWESIIHPDDLPAFDAQLQKHLHGETAAIDCDLRLRTRSGHYEWFRTRGKIVKRDRFGKPARLVGTVLGIQIRKRAQAELAKSRALLEAVLGSTDDIIWSVDSESFRLLTYNEAFVRLCEQRGLSVRAGMQPEELGPLDRATLWRTLYQKVLEQGKIDCDMELPGSANAVHITSHLLSRDGRVFGISLFAHDITERKKMEEDLRKSEEKFAKAFMEAPMVMTLTSARDHRYIEVNEFYENVTGFRREEVIGKTPFDIKLWASPEARVKIVQDVLKEGKAREIEFQFRTKSGELRDALGSGEVIEINGEPCLLAASVDVTDRKRTEQALRDSEQRLSLAVQTGRMYAFEWDPKNHTVKRSRESAQILGENGPNGEELISMVHPEDREYYGKAVSSATVENPTYRVVFRLPRPDGTISWLQESGHAFFDANGNVERVVGMVADITESRESELALRELSGRLITSQEEERRRVARELHDNIGQALALLSVQAQRLDSGVADREHTVHSDVHELYKRIKDIAANVSKLSHRLHSSELEFLGLGVAAERLCRDFSRQYNIEVDCSAQDLPQQIETNVALCFYRVIQESLQNVAKHSHATNVELVLCNRDGKLFLSIVDNGQGFAKEKSGYGSGLGLISMRERVRVIGGELSITPTIGQGTRLEVTAALPVLSEKYGVK